MEHVRIYRTLSPNITASYLFNAYDKRMEVALASPRLRFDVVEGLCASLCERAWPGGNTPILSIILLAPNTIAKRQPFVFYLAGGGEEGTQSTDGDPSRRRPYCSKGTKQSVRTVARLYFHRCRSTKI